MQPWQQQPADQAIQLAYQAYLAAQQAAQQAARLAAQQPTNQAAQQAAKQADQRVQLTYQVYQATLQAQQTQQGYSQKCPTCGIQNRSDAHFCNSCGAPLPRGGPQPHPGTSVFKRVLLTLYCLAVLALILSVLYFFFLH